MESLNMLQMRSTAVPFDALAPFGDVGILQALSRGGLPDFPRFDPRAPHPASQSSYLDRNTLATLVGDANPHLPPPAPETSYVVAGQQAGLMLGPLYTFLKAVTAIGVAEEAQAHRDEPVAPLFWVASEDHDILEVNHFEVFGERFTHEADIPLARGRRPQVADVSLEDTRGPLMAFLERTLPDTDFRPQVLDLVAETDFTSYATAAHSLLKRLFAAWTLRTIDPIALRPLTSPVLADLADQWAQVGPALRAGARRLEDAGVRAPLDSAGIFDVAGGPRRMVLSTDPNRSGPSPSELADTIRRHPERFSPSAALRPILQDAVVPVAATLGGPSELAYLWQVHPLYELVAVRTSPRHPRISVTFIEPAVARSARKAGLTVDALVYAPEALRRLNEKLHPRRTAEGAATPPPTGMLAKAISNATAVVDEDPDIERVAEHGRRTLDAIDALVVEPAPRWLRKGRDSIASGLEKVLTRLREERQTAATQQQTRLEKIAEALFPGHRLQERSVNLLQFLNQYGLTFVDAAVRELAHATVARPGAHRDAHPGAYQDRPTHAHRSAPPEAAPDRRTGALPEGHPYVHHLVEIIPARGESGPAKSSGPEQHPEPEVEHAPTEGDHRDGD